MCNSVTPSSGDSLAPAFTPVVVGNDVRWKPTSSKQPGVSRRVFAVAGEGTTLLILVKRHHEGLLA